LWIADRLPHRSPSVPELADIANLTTKKLFGVFSENMGPEQYKALAIAIGEEIEKGADGIVVGHGTDTMAHTAAILSFMVQNSPVPIVIVGSQRSSDRPSSDAALNLEELQEARLVLDAAFLERDRCDIGCGKHLSPVPSTSTSTRFSRASSTSGPVGGETVPAKRR
jgi:glutamyl-tRNA(Gln) amidotransferase subunit D